MDEFGDSIISVSDEDGNSFELTILDEAVYNGIRYFALVEAKDISEEENAEVIIMKEIEADGETMLSTMDSDEELEAVLQLFEDRMFGDEEDDDLDS